MNTTRKNRFAPAALGLALGTLLALMPDARAQQGRIEQGQITSAALTNNLYGDPATRSYHVYLPPSYDTGTNRYPVVYVLHGWYEDNNTMVGLLQSNLDFMIQQRSIGEMIAVFPNASNLLWGWWYFSSPVIGDYETYIAKDLVQLINARYRTLPARESRAVTGGSMGGFGVMHLALKFPDVFSVAVAEAGLYDSRSQHANGAEQALASCYPTNSAQFAALMSVDWRLCALQALFAGLLPDPQRPSLYTDYPYEWANGQPVLNASADQRCRQGDVQNGDLPRYLLQPLRLNGIKIVHGTNDTAAPVITARDFTNALAQAGVLFEYQEHSGGHVYVPDLALPFLSGHLQGAAPVIAQQPQSCTNVAGSTATFSVVATPPPLAYQWQRDTTIGSFDFWDLAGCTNVSLVLTNLQPSDMADYRVVVTNAGGAVTSAVAQLTVATPPRITAQPTNFPSVSLGVNLSNQVRATGTPPLVYQWCLNGIPLAGRTNPSLNLTNVQMADAGAYTVVVTNLAGVVTSHVALLNPDPTFTKVTTGPLVTDLACWHPAAWGDYNNDGYPDVYVHQKGPQPANVLYRNNGDGTFTRVLEPTLQHTARAAMGGAWGDYDNDGHLDLFIANDTGVNVLLHNRGDGTFDWIRSGPGAEGGMACAAVWGDYDGDGFLDLFVGNGAWDMEPGINCLYHNNGDGTLSKVTPNQAGCNMLSEAQPWGLGSWVDYDQDGLLDLLVDGYPEGVGIRLYHNLGAGRFANVSNAFAGSFAWADYDNDGELDLFTASFDTSTANALYHNEGSGTFKKMSAAQVGSLVTDTGVASGVAWGDYDNDGFLDLFIARGFWYQEGSGYQTSLLYHNNGDGTFTPVTTGSPANDVGQAFSGNWVDYDRDGFLDLFVSEYGHDVPASHRLYHNNGNSNNWLCVTCVGTASPRDGTGARVRALVTIRGKPMWQLRLINSGGTSWGGQSFVAHFGLGEATNVDVLRIEWTSGTVQELYNVPAKQYLTVTEPARLSMPSLGQLHIQCWKGMAYRIETSPDLLTWTPQATVTNLNLRGGISWTDPSVPGPGARFYRTIKQ